MVLRGPAAADEGGRNLEKQNKRQRGDSEIQSRQTYPTGLEAPSVNWNAICLVNRVSPSTVSLGDFLFEVRLKGFDLPFGYYDANTCVL